MLFLTGFPKIGFTVYCRVAITAVLLVLLGHRSLSAEPLGTSGAERRFTLPILTVTDRNEGQCGRLRFTFARNAGAAPLSLAVVEDTPGGAGESLRASLWLAAMVAALDRMDPLAGSTVSLELSGSVDGPSAGAGLCLAILSVLDGRDFPEDCAVTGAIMPDGTIGGVGGIAAKLRAAARSGIRRVMIPTYLRIEKQPGSEEEVDLKRLAAELRLELIPVDNVGQAYAALHGLEKTPRQNFERSILELPPNMEEVLKRRYQTHRQTALELWNGTTQQDRELLASDPTLQALFLDPQFAAENAYRSGRLGLAVENAWSWRTALAGYNAYVKLLNTPGEEWIPRDAVDAAAKAQRRLDKLADGFLRLDTLLNTQAKVSEASAQLWADGFDLAGMTGFRVVFQAGIDQQLAEARKPGLKASEAETLRDEVFIRGQYLLLLAHVAAEGSRTWPQELEALGVALPPRTIGEQAEEVERLIYSSHLAVRNTFRHDVVNQLADELRVSPAQALTTLNSIDSRSMTHEPAVVAVQAVHNQALGKKEAAPRRFALAVSAHLQAEALAGQSALTVRWSQLDSEVDEQGRLIYGRTDLLNYLINTARENALHALADCREKNMVPLGPITRFESAEMARDDIETDKVDVLAEYWRASLQAKTLMMLCGSTENAPPPASATSARKPVSSNSSPAVMKKPSAELPPANSRALGTPPSLTTLGQPEKGTLIKPVPRWRFPFQNQQRQFPLSDGSASEWGWPKIGVFLLVSGLISMLQGWWGGLMRKKPAAEVPPSETIAVDQPRRRTWLQRASFACGASVRRFLKLIS